MVHFQISTINKGIAPAHPYVFFQIQPEGQDHIDDKRGAEGHERYIDKPEADARCGNTKLLTNSGADAKGFPFDEILK
jgi:hypothetical protein